MRPHATVVRTIALKSLKSIPVHLFNDELIFGIEDATCYCDSTASSRSILVVGWPQTEAHRTSKQCSSAPSDSFRIYLLSIPQTQGRFIFKVLRNLGSFTFVRQHYMHVIPSHLFFQSPQTIHTTATKMLPTPHSPPHNNNNILRTRKELKAK